MDPSRIAVAVVGVGHLGRHHARLYAEHPGAELVAVVDRDGDRARAIAAEYGCEAHTELKPILGRVRAASVAAPTVVHRPISEALLAHGADVLVEKPIAPSLDDADAIIAAGERHGRLVMVGHTERFNPAFMAMARVVDGPRFFEIHRLAAFTARSVDIDVVLDLMIHDLDLVLHLDGTPAVSVEAVGIDALTDKIDIANARLRMESGCVANLTASRISPSQVRRVRVVQPRCYVACDTVKRDAERFRLTRGPDGRPAIEHDRLTVEEGEPLAIELAEFLRAVRSRVRPPVDGRHARDVLDLALRIGEAIATPSDRS